MIDRRRQPRLHYSSGTQGAAEGEIRGGRHTVPVPHFQREEPRVVIRPAPIFGHGKPHELDWIRAEHGTAQSPPRRCVQSGPQIIELGSHQVGALF